MAKNSAISNAQITAAIELKFAGKKTKEIISILELPVNLEYLEQIFTRLRKMGLNVPKKRLMEVSASALAEIMSARFKKKKVEEIPRDALRRERNHCL